MTKTLTTASHGSITVQEFKAVLAHEFGHYHAGDVKLGPWIYKTRAAMGRTIAHLDGNILQKLFLWYGQLFLRITHAVSRRQEFIADEVAARAAGAGVMMSGLRKVHTAPWHFTGTGRVRCHRCSDGAISPPLPMASAGS